jgi:D-sedoheptulose 7-phosphate isomerase
MNTEFINETLNDLIQNLNQFKKTKFQSNLIEVAKVINKNLNSRNIIFSCGNGGSASQASHFTTELIVRFKKKYERKPHASVCLGSDMSMFTAIGNDYGFEFIFSRELEGLGKKNDCVIFFSTSGNSKNLIKAADKAKSLGIKTISITGNNGGKLKKITDMNINIDSHDTARIQECHLYIIHLLIELIEIENNND